MDELNLGPLVWITRQYAVNPANIVMLFHGKGGQITISFVSGDPLKTLEDDLTDEAAALLFRGKPHTARRNGVISPTT